MFGKGIEIHEGDMTDRELIEVIFNKAMEFEVEYHAPATVASLPEWVNDSVISVVSEEMGLAIEVQPNKYVAIIGRAVKDYGMVIESDAESIIAAVRAIAEVERV